MSYKSSYRLFLLIFVSINSSHLLSGDLSGPRTGERKLVHGGSWDENSVNLRSSFRNVKRPESGKSIYGSLGFRCAYDK